MLFISSLFPRLNCTICPEMKKRIAKTVFLDSFCCCYLFGKHLRGQNKIVQSALAHEFKEKKDGNGKKERKKERDAHIFSRLATISQDFPFLA